MTTIVAVVAFTVMRWRPLTPFDCGLCVCKTAAFMVAKHGGLYGRKKMAFTAMRWWPLTHFDCSLYFHEMTAFMVARRQPLCLQDAVSMVVTWWPLDCDMAAFTAVRLRPLTTFDGGLFLLYSRENAAFTTVPSFCSFYINLKSHYKDVLK